MHKDDHPTHNERQSVSNDDQSLSISDAAQRLGLSAATIRRRIKERKIAAFQRPTERGFEWRVLPEQSVGNVDRWVINDMQNDDQPVHIDAQQVIIDVQNDDQDTDDEEDPPSITEVVQVLIGELREEYRERIAELEEKNERNLAAASHWQARYQDAERRAIQAEEQVRLLMAPKDEPVERESPAEPDRRPWWRRLLSNG